MCIQMSPKDSTSRAAGEIAGEIADDWRSERGAQRVLAGAMVWHVYRDESGALVMYDEYAAYLVAQELGRQMIEVKILESTAA